MEKKIENIGSHSYKEKQVERTIETYKPGPSFGVPQSLIKKKKKTKHFIKSMDRIRDDGEMYERLSSALNDSSEDRGGYTEREIMMNNYNSGKVSSSLLPGIKSPSRNVFPSIENKTLDDDEVEYKDSISRSKDLLKSFEQKLKNK